MVVKEEIQTVKITVGKTATALSVCFRTRLSNRLHWFTPQSQLFPIKFQQLTLNSSDFCEIILAKPKKKRSVSHACSNMCWKKRLRTQGLDEMKHLAEMEEKHIRKTKYLQDPDIIGIFTVSPGTWNQSFCHYWTLGVVCFDAKGKRGLRSLEAGRFCLGGWTLV